MEINICSSCTFWRATSYNKIGMCKVKNILTKWYNKCREYIPFIEAKLRGEADD